MLQDFKVNILLIEDNPGDVRLLQEYLLMSGKVQYELFVKNTLKEGKEFLLKGENKVDIILLDLILTDSLPSGESDRLVTFDNLYSEFPEYPYIVLTGFKDEKIGLEAVQRGAQDFLDKNDLDTNLLIKSIRYSIQRYENEVERRNMLSRLEKAQQLAKVGDWNIHLETNKLYCSPQVYNIFELPSQYQFLTFEDYLMAVHPEDQTRVAMEMLEVFKNHTDLYTEHRIITPNGEDKLIALKGEMVKKNGEISSLVGTVQDITERNKIETLKREKDLAQKAFKVRQEFLAKTSHEIRTPLNPILNLTDILLSQTNPTPHQRSLLETIKTAGDTLLAVVNDILDLSKIEAGTIDFSKETFHLKKVIHSLREMMELNIQEKQVKAQREGKVVSDLKMLVDLDEEIPAFLLGDAVRLSQILLNLTGNAIKFTDEGSIHIQAQCLNKTEDKVQIRFTVADTGIGIPKDQLNLIFESFRQVDSGLNRKYGGAGLGLTIVKQLVVLQGGEIFVDSSLGEGSVFGFDLTFGIDHEGTESTPNLQESEKRLEGMKVLIVEDNETNQIVTQTILDSWGIETDLANNGLECVDKLRQNNYDLILMDIQMPEMDGYEATRFIRKEMQPPARDIAIVALTANAFSGSDDRCLQEGMDDYISKPVKNDSLYAKISRYAPKKQALVPEPSLPTGSIPDYPQPENSFAGYMNEPEPTYTNGHHHPEATNYTDLSYLNDTLGDSMIIKKTISKFIETTPGLLEKMDEHLKNGEFKELSKCAHKLKSSIDTMGIESLRQVIRSIEQKAKNNERLEMIPEQVTETRRIIEHSFVELRQKMEAL
ncbi:MAG: response regulator [Bacteroidota bacterium]